MKSSEKFFNTASPLFAIAIFALGFIFSVEFYNTVSWLAGVSTFFLGVLCTVLFAMGMHVWNERMYSDAAEKAKTLFFKISMLGIIVMIIGGLFFMSSPTDFAVNCLVVGASLFAAPVIIAALCGLIRYISDRIWIYRMC